MKPTPLPPATLQRLEAAVVALRAGRPGEARVLLTPVLAEFPKLTEARRLLALARRDEGDLAGAEAELRAAIAADKRQPALHAELGKLLAALNRSAEAERAFRAALQLDRRFSAAAAELSNLLMADGRAAEALQVTTPAALAPNADEAVLTAHSNALRAVDRAVEAVTFNTRAVAVAPRSAVAEHNLAAGLGDLGRAEEAEAACARAFAKGGQAPEIWMVRARALQQLARLDEADAAYREALRRRPDYADAHRDLAQLIWMRTGDEAAATLTLDRALAAHPQAAGLALHKAKLQEFADDPAGAYATLTAALARNPAVVPFHLAASHAAGQIGEARLQLQHAQAGVALAPADRAARLSLCAAHLAIGEADVAAALAQQIRAEAPWDQYALALLATAWRLLGDRRYAELYAYAAFVGAARIDVPEGWATLDAYLADLAPALERVHSFQTHPLEQSLRHGSQAPHLAASRDPAIKAFFGAIDGPIRRYLAALGLGKDALRARNGRGYRLRGSWSVRLRSSGHHTDHVHTEGWISSACYVALPKVMAKSANHEGWIKFGEPGIPTQPPLRPEHFVEPQPGLLVLFPSYMWHGTVPFTGDDHRLTIAFDLLPGK